jgi:hypothetical protein
LVNLSSTLPETPVLMQNLTHMDGLKRTQWGKLFPLCLMLLTSSYNSQHKWEEEKKRIAFQAPNKECGFWSQIGLNSNPLTFCFIILEEITSLLRASFAP